MEVSIDLIDAGLVAGIAGGVLFSLLLLAAATFAAVLLAGAVTHAWQRRRAARTLEAEVAEVRSMIGRREAMRPLTHRSQVSRAS